MTTQRMTEDDRDPYAVELGAAIHQHMWRQRMTTAQLGLVLGVTQSTASKKVRGVTPVTVSELMRIAGALDVDPRDLLPRLDSNQQPSGYPSAQVSGVVVDLFTGERVA